MTATRTRGRTDGRSAQCPPSAYPGPSEGIFVCLTTAHIRSSAYNSHFHEIISIRLGRHRSQIEHTMPKKRASKRLKTEKPTPQPLGSGAAALLDESLKDDEERRLESLLFGTKFTPRRRDDANILIITDDEDSDGELEGGNELQNLLDTDVSLPSRFLVPNHQ